ncbi:MAG: bifunctional histidinol-phosphatase/imidazoleglycerol-phosphate dehydratase HisB, partial [Hymenobacteraceae bacterium]|nr:bifunctional histidinol-phosphatase/imidazoleglycerol-phosphate dehydratase HisB [Hymenobacteraceae bacterium]
LFIDRDGTILIEPQPDQQIDSLTKFQFVPGAITALARLARETDFRLILVSNQDGLGTASFPEDTFWPPQNLMLDILAGEGISFDAIYIDRSFPHENLPTRKPGTALLTEYFDGSRYDLANSYVIGDRLTDVQLAQNLGSRAILLQDGEPVAGAELTTMDWDAIYRRLRWPARTAAVRRTTRETDIEVRVDLDGPARADVRTGLSFLDHMLDQLGRHGGINLFIRTTGDLHIDEHHTVEDTALALGEALKTALGDKRGLTRYGFVLPMDEARATVALDFSGRPDLVWEAEFRRERVGDVPTELFRHFFKSLCDTAALNLHIRVQGDNEHHKIESIFKGFARALRAALRREEQDFETIPSTKGTL